MQNQPIDKTTDIIQPLNDTWGIKGADDNFWAITSSLDDEVLALIESNAIVQDLVEYVEVIYNDSTGQEQRITFQVQNGGWSCIKEKY
ncbi:MAG: hypothetical protein V7L04_30280 [Nostoc sp.]|uniref:hypothetical protein n=1 Tax=Nostoc sp. TaxID=1180 RepID=UPI002FF9F910